MKNLLIILCVQFLAIILIALASVQLTDEKDVVSNQSAYKQYVAIFPPELNYQQIVGRIVASRGVPVREGFWDFIHVSASKEDVYAKVLKEHGAIFVFDPIIKGSCIVQSKNKIYEIKSEV